MNKRPQIVLYQPDIPGNTGTILRLAACFDLIVNIIEPAGFRLDDKSLQRAGMDYTERAKLVRHDDWSSFQNSIKSNGGRLILLTTKSDVPYTEVVFKPNDYLMFGRESAGVPEGVHEAVDLSVTIPMAATGRSLNVAMSVALVTGEALRQLT